MPATSTKQRQLMAIAEHHPEKVHKENRGVLKMSKGQLHDFAATKGLAKHGKHSRGSGAYTADDMKRGYKPWLDRMREIRGKG